MSNLYVKLFTCLILITNTLNEDNYYKILDVKRNATQQEIKKAFRRLSKKYHPDVSKEKDAEDRFKEINEAYEVLSDETKRSKYDRYGKEGLKDSPSSGGFDPFEGFFGRRGNMQEEEETGDPLVVPLYVNLEDIYNGRTLKIFMTKKSLCQHCRGSGAEDPDDVETCSKCHGTGVFVQRVQVQPGFIQQMQMRCPKCQGKGKIIKSKCSVCKGSKILEDLETFSIQIEKGMKYGEKIILAKSAQDYVDKLSSDLIFEIKETQHNFYKRKNDKDLTAKLEISLYEALAGFDKRLRTLDDRFIHVKKEGVTQPGQITKIDNEGLPEHNYSYNKGDLYIEHDIKMPEELTEEQKELFKKFFEAANQF